jgi:hypothetical protein
MPNGLPAGPYRTLRLDDGTDVPYYIIPFDKKGRCEGPETRRHLVDAVTTTAVTDIFLFSHGCNNDWTVATKRYQDFMNGYIAMRRTRNLSMPASYRPLLVGVFWPSTALVFGTVEEGPAIAAGDPAAIDAQGAAVRFQQLTLWLNLCANQSFSDLPVDDNQSKLAFQAAAQVCADPVAQLTLDSTEKDGVSPLIQDFH